MINVMHVVIKSTKCILNLKNLRQGRDYFAKPRVFKKIFSVD